MGHAARLAILLLAGSLALGCFVLEELDEAQKLSSGPRAAAKAAPEESPPEATEPSSGPGPLERLQAWWAKRQEPKPPARHADDVMVRCQAGGRTWYTRKFDCLARGGTAEPAGATTAPGT
jgi:hypothetical protein